MNPRASHAATQGPVARNAERSGAELHRHEAKSSVYHGRLPAKAVRFWRPAINDLSGAVGMVVLDCAVGDLTPLVLCGSKQKLNVLGSERVVVVQRRDP
jgi:hypothetical protein